MKTGEYKILTLGIAWNNQQSPSKPKVTKTKKKVASTHLDKKTHQFTWTREPKGVYNGTMNMETPEIQKGQK